MTHDSVSTKIGAKTLNIISQKLVTIIVLYWKLYPLFLAHHLWHLTVQVRTYMCVCVCVFYKNIWAYTKPNIISLITPSIKVFSVMICYTFDIK
jgi:hypothetical protein